MAKSINSKTWNLGVEWDGRRYSDTLSVPTFIAPSGLTVSSSGTTNTISWTNGTATAQTVIQRSLTGTGGWSLIDTKAAGVITHSDTGLVNGTYYYRAKHLQNAHYSAYSNTDNGVIIAVSTPTGFTATIDSYDITLSWVDETGGIAQHVIQSSPNGSTSWSTIATKDAGVVSHTITGLSDGDYYYRIYATYSGEVSSYAYADATIVTPLSAPSNFTASVSGSTVSFSWTDNNGGTADTRIEVSTTSGESGFSTLTTVAAGLSSYEANNVASDDYWYRILAVDGVDTSPVTASVAITVSTSSGGGIGIDSITGTISDGATVTLNGGSFGTMGGDVLGFIRGDEAANNTIAHGTTPTIGSSVDTYIIGVGDDTTGDYIRYVTAASRGNKARGVRRVHTGNVTSTYKAGGFGFTGLNTTKYFASYYRRNNTTWNTTNEYNYKQFYTFGNVSNSPQTMLFIPAKGNSVGFYNNNPLNADSYSVKNMLNTANWHGVDEDNTWHKWEVYTDFANTPTTRNGVLQVWRNRTLGINSSTWIGRGPNYADTTYTTQFYLGYMDANFEGSFDFTDFYIATTPARIEFGNASTWSACTHTEIQIVRNANWADTTISSVTINYGSFTSGQTVYMYVIKSDGQPVANSGYSVVLP